MLDRIIIINLKRRADRKQAILKQLDSNCTIPISFFNAIDGLKIDDEYLKKQGISTFKKWKTEKSHSFLNKEQQERYYNRDINTGEIACTLSHHYVWKKIVEENIKHTLILEDDAVPTLPVWQALINIQLEKLSQTDIKWDFLYAGRQQLMSDQAILSPSICQPSYSWTSHAYILSIQGAKKLLKSNLLEQLIPVDEYLPAMQGEHPRRDIRHLFQNFQKLNAFALNPNLFVQNSVGKESDIEE